MFTQTAKKLQQKGWQASNKHQPPGPDKLSPR